MKNNKTIYDLFGESEIHVKPSPKAWDVLERKLETKRDKQKRFFKIQYTRQMTLAASFLAFVIVGGLITFYVLKNNSSAQLIKPYNNEVKEMKKQNEIKNHPFVEDSLSEVN